MISGEKLFFAGGTLLYNPSRIGGTWAWCYVNHHDMRVREEFDVLPTSREEAGLQFITIY